MNKLFLLLIFLAYNLHVYSQSPRRDTAWYVEMKDSTILYSKKLSVRNSIDKGDYLLLDNNKEIPMSQVLRYKNRAGDFIRDRGPVETYQIEKGGPRLFVYSRKFYYQDSTGTKEDKKYFFRKDSTTGDMLKMDYKNLKDAMADNPVALQMLESGRAKLRWSGITAGASLVMLGVGMLQTSHKNMQRLKTSPPGGSYVSPFLYAGGALFVATLAIRLSAIGHMNKSIKIYNQ